MDLHVVFTDSAVLLSRRRYASWRAIQDEFADYKASLGPWSPEVVIDWLGSEYSDLSPAAREQVHGFLAGSHEVAEVTFAARP